MSAMIDTLQASEDLKAAGMPDAQAVAVTKVFGRAFDGNDLVTQPYLKNQLENLEARLTLKLSVIMGGLLALFAAVDRFFA
ncbi:MAG: hypothetical protein MRY64_08940 [Hyphomonadaceae bacterium]|nr:hypothetical protein [Hyphomonadaceae bacterium]